MAEAAGPRPVVDPTQNVKDLVEEVVIRLDLLREAEGRLHTELREADRRYVDAELRHVSEKAELRAAYAEKLEIAEAKRIDAIRSVDVNAVAIANERATAAATVLANQVTQSAETLRTLVAQTAANNKQQLDQTTAQLSDRLSSLEKLQYEGKGLSGTIPPSVVEQLAQLQESRYRNEGRSGLSAPLLATVVGIVAAAISAAIVGFLT